jgi:S-DNA-T family DNA segregation ATPase FtsK/SpoIIIE
MARVAGAKAGPTVLGATVADALREGALWVFGALALLLLAALATYHSGDPGFSYTGVQDRVSNAIGPFGAFTADLFFLLFGKPAYLFPAMLAYAGCLILRDRGPAESLTGRDLALRGFGFVVTLATSCGLATLHFSSAGLPHTAGGVLGDQLGTGLVAVFSFLGATLLMLAVWLAGVSLFAGVSWLAIMDRVGRATLFGVDWLQARVAAAREALASRKVTQARREEVKRKKKQTENRPPPRIEPVMPKLETSERVEK